MSWDRIQRMQMEAMHAEARFRAEIEQLSEQVAQLRESRRRLTVERDLARDVAVRLEQENAALLAELETAPLDVVYVPMMGEAT